MEPLLYVMAILGCGEGDAPCREVAVAERRYANEQQCLAATEDELLRRDDLAFPAVVAQCRRDGAAPRLLRGSEVALPDAPAARPRRARLASSDRR
jgi:hypothetical protein